MRHQYHTTKQQVDTMKLFWKHCLIHSEKAIIHDQIQKEFLYWISNDDPIESQCVLFCGYLFKIFEHDIDGLYALFQHLNDPNLHLNIQFIRSFLFTMKSVSNFQLYASVFIQICTALFDMKCMKLSFTLINECYASELNQITETLSHKLHMNLLSHLKNKLEIETVLNLIQTCAPSFHIQYLHDLHKSLDSISQQSDKDKVWKSNHKHVGIARMLKQTNDKIQDLIFNNAHARPQIQSQKQMNATCCADFSKIESKMNRVIQDIACMNQNNVQFKLKLRDIYHKIEHKYKLYQYHGVTKYLEFVLRHLPCHDCLVQQVSVLLCVISVYHQNIKLELDLFQILQNTNTLEVYLSLICTLFPHITLGIDGDSNAMNDNTFVMQNEKIWNCIVEAYTAGEGGIYELVTNHLCLSKVMRQWLSQMNVSSNMNIAIEYKLTLKHKWDLVPFIRDIFISYLQNKAMYSHWNWSQFWRIMDGFIKCQGSVQHLCSIVDMQDVLNHKNIAYYWAFIAQIPSIIFAHDNEDDRSQMKMKIQGILNRYHSWIDIDRMNQPLINDICTATDRFMLSDDYGINEIQMAYDWYHKYKDKVKTVQVSQLEKTLLEFTVNDRHLWSKSRMIVMLYVNEYIESQCLISFLFHSHQWRILLELCFACHKVNTCKLMNIIADILRFDVGETIQLLIQMIEMNAREANTLQTQKVSLCLTCVSYQIVVLSNRLFNGIKQNTNYNHLEIIYNYLQSMEIEELAVSDQDASQMHHYVMICAFKKLWISSLRCIILDIFKEDPQSKIGA